jgi:hypothetical protein
MTDSPGLTAAKPTALSVAEQPSMQTNAFEATRQTFNTASGSLASF